MRKEERRIYYDEDLRIQLYEFRGISQKFTPHFHEGYVIGLMEAGQREFICGGRKYTLSENDILLIHPHETHGCVQCGDEDLHYFSMNISRGIMRRTVRDITGRAFYPQFNASVIRKDEASALFYEFRELAGRKQKDFRKEEVFFFLMEYLLKLCPGTYEAGTDIGGEPDGMERVCGYLEENSSRNIRLDELSRLTGVSKYHLLRCFTKEKGISPHKYLETIRIEKSKKMLEKGIPIIDTALLSGFSDQSHYSNVFKSLTGVTPGAYQAIAKENTNREVKS